MMIYLKIYLTFTKATTCLVIDTANHMENGRSAATAAASGREAMAGADDTEWAATT